MSKNCRNLKIVLCSYYFTFRLWENWYELWVENFLRFTRETKIGLEKPILKFRVPAGHEKFQRLREANFCLPREPEKTFHEQFISVWAHPKGKILRTDCFISCFGVFVCNSSKIKIYFATIMNQVMNAPSFQEFPWK